DKSHTRPRVLTIGDSCTFGTIESRSYPRVLERELSRMGHFVEVVNAGVEAYAPKQVLMRIDEYRSLRPEITTVYIGWNALFNETEAFGGIYTGDGWFCTPRLFSLAYAGFHTLLRGSQANALDAYRKRKVPRRDSHELNALDNYVPAFLDDVERIVDGMRSVQSRIVLITLPGLYILDEEPSERALEIGHLPIFTNNPYVLAKMTTRYNVALRQLARRHEVTLIDLDQWSRRALHPRDRYFFDSVHLYEEGQELIGAHLAEQLLPLLPKEKR
ncbi:MAG: SGNH/GDSL hydrolase family protein, partial [Acidimicrobiia bacterium]